MPVRSQWGCYNSPRFLACSWPALPDRSSVLGWPTTTWLSSTHCRSQIRPNSAWRPGPGQPRYVLGEDWLYLKRKKDHSHTVIPKNKWLWFNHNQLEQHRTSQTCNHGSWSSILYTFLYTVGLKTRKIWSHQRPRCDELCQAGSIRLVDHLKRAGSSTCLWQPAWH